MKKYDIFISYRREGGYATAQAIEASLSKRGYRVFLDVEGLRSGEFNKQLYQVIDGCKDVLVICSPNSLDRCKNDGDWVRSEIAYAIRKNKNIIPVYVNGFQCPEPENLPEDIRNIVNYQALTPSPQTFSASLQILGKRYMKSKPIYPRMILYAIVFIMLISFSIFAVRQYFLKVNTLSNSEISAIDQTCVTALSTIQLKADSCLKGLNTCKVFLDGDISKENMIESLEHFQKQMDTSIMPDVPDVRVDYPAADFCTALSEQAENSGVYRRYLDFARWLVLESGKSSSSCRTILEYMETVVHKDYLNALNRAFGAFLPISNRYERKESGDYRYSTIYAVYFNDKSSSEIAGSATDSLFGNSNDNIRPEQIHEQINGSTDPIIKKIENMVGDKWQEMLEGDNK